MQNKGRRRKPASAEAIARLAEKGTRRITILHQHGAHEDTKRRVMLISLRAC